MRLRNTPAIFHILVDRATFCMSELRTRSERDSNSMYMWESAFRRPPLITSSGSATRSAFPWADASTKPLCDARVVKAVPDYFSALTSTRAYLTDIAEPLER
jgi:hypothetical protein